jgi:hypothetical protein
MTNETLSKSKWSNSWVSKPVSWMVELFKAFDRRMDGAASFFVKHWGKSKFMVAMSKKAQYMGLEKLFLKGPKAFMYFFLFYLVRDTILYIILPIWFASLVD